METYDSSSGGIIFTWLTLSDYADKVDQLNPSYVMLEAYRYIQALSPGDIELENGYILDIAFPHTSQSRPKGVVLV